MQSNSNSKKLSVKWGKENFSLEVFSSTISELKSLLSEKTLVEPNRQKLFFKGKVLDDSYLLSNIAEGSLLTMTGTASMDSAINLNTDKKVVFLEDLSNEEKAKILREKGSMLAKVIKSFCELTNSFVISRLSFDLI
jgi:lipoprotein NlpI